jgi:hypothetical protein
MLDGVTFAKLYGQCGSAEQPRPLSTGGREPGRSFQAGSSGTERAATLSASRGLLQLRSNYLIWAKRRRRTVPQLSVELVSEYRGQSSVCRETLSDGRFLMDRRCHERVTKTQCRVVDLNEARGDGWGKVIHGDGRINNGCRGERLTDGIAIVDGCHQEQRP